MHTVYIHIHIHIYSIVVVNNNVVFCHVRCQTLQTSKSFTTSAFTTSAFTTSAGRVTGFPSRSKHLDGIRLLSTWNISQKHAAAAQSPEESCRVSMELRASTSAKVPSFSAPLQQTQNMLPATTTGAPRLLAQSWAVLEDHQIKAKSQVQLFFWWKAPSRSDAKNAQDHQKIDSFLILAEQVTHRRASRRSEQGWPEWPAKSKVRQLNKIVTTQRLRNVLKRRMSLHVDKHVGTQSHRPRKCMT